MPINPKYDNEPQEEDASHLIDKTHSTLDVADSQNPSVVHPEMVEGKDEEEKEIPKGDTILSGDRCTGCRKR